ncbi:MAG: hypothetical protein GF408_05020 [Candidatus Omnitrophica bacterium]|nr:hypothetical protein [Candidatus Omnitrophota bacterium]
MWTKWFPWRFIISNLAKKHGFIDPIQLVASVNRMAQPSEVAAPVELLRVAAVLHARGLINSQVIQNNLDWIWPYWVEKQFDPRTNSFVPRAFSLTHINLTHRNWTAVGLPGIDAFPIVDPRGLVTPLFDSWSLDAWVISESGRKLFPSRCEPAAQSLEMEKGLGVRTEFSGEGMSLVSMVSVGESGGEVLCRMRLKAECGQKGTLAVSLRPFNPEGVSFVHEVSGSDKGWLVNGKDEVRFDRKGKSRVFSDYRKGDVAHRLTEKESAGSAKCEVGLVSAAEVFDIEPGSGTEVEVTVPLRVEKASAAGKEKIIMGNWDAAVSACARLEVPDKRIEYIYDAAVRSLVLLSPGEVYPGPYTYKHFWFRDAVYALNAMLSVNMSREARRILDLFPRSQGPTGYFRSQEGEWDSNGQVLWIMNRYSELAGEPPPEAWERPIRSAVSWIERKRSSGRRPPECEGLFPAGFSAEHFGPNDFYYWDDFWGAAGLEAGERLARITGKDRLASRCGAGRNSFMNAINSSIERAREQKKIAGMPVSPYRRMDSSAVGSLVAGYPLKLYAPDNRMLLATAEYLMENNFIDGLFYHEIAHSGINIYLSLQIAQVLLRAGDPRYLGIVKAAADVASSTAQWPEAIHPKTKGGCMGDGQHLWASSEWILIVRNCFLREEGDTLILCSGIPGEWLREGERVFFGPAPTSFGTVSVSAESSEGKISVQISSHWHGAEPRLEVRLPGERPAVLEPGKNRAVIERGKR